MKTLDEQFGEKFWSEIRAVSYYSNTFGDEIKQFYNEKIKEIVEEMIGKEDDCSEDMFIKENGIDYANGEKFYSNGYNNHRKHCKKIAKKYIEQII